jgi:hypothetical protein
MLAMKPEARSKRQMSKKNKSMKRTQEDRIAAMVNTTVTINHAHKYNASAWLKLGSTTPVAASVYADNMPVPGR